MERTADIIDIKDAWNRLRGRKTKSMENPFVKFGPSASTVSKTPSPAAQKIADDYAWELAALDFADFTS